MQLIGLSDSPGVVELEVRWPTSRTTQTFRDLRSDQAIEVTEGAAEYRVRRMMSTAGDAQ